MNGGNKRIPWAGLLLVCIFLAAGQPGAAQSQPANQNETKPHYPPPPVATNLPPPPAYLITEHCDIRYAVEANDLGNAMGWNNVSQKTLIQIMDYRYLDMGFALDGYRATGVPLVELRGNYYGPAGALNDYGSYYLVIQIVRLTGVEVPRAIDILYDGGISLAWLFMLAGFLLVLQTARARMLAAIGLTLMACLALYYNDLYSFLFISATPVPWLLWLNKRRPGFIWAALLVFASGLLIGLANEVRSHSGTGVFLFAVALLLFNYKPKLQSLLLVAVLIAGSFTTYSWFRHVGKVRDDFLTAKCPQYPRFGEQRPFWHSVYIGLGFLSNPTVPRYDDFVGLARAREDDPWTLFDTDAYGNILRKATFEFIRSHKSFFLQSLAAKGGVILFVLLLTGNIGWLAWYMKPMPWREQLPFWLAIGFNSMFGFLVVPLVHYLAGMETFAVFFALVSVDHWIVGPQK